MGLTGGIGSGKSAASTFFHNKGILIVDADIVAREIVEPGKPAWIAIKEYFGSDAISSDDTLDRAWLRAKIFSEPLERQWLERQTHPRIRDSIIQQLEAASSPYAILTSPLLFESDQALLIQRSLLIDTSEDIQLARACARDGNNREQIRRIMNAQMSRNDRQIRADDIVDNSGTLDDLYAQLEPLHQHYLSLASAHL